MIGLIFRVLRVADGYQGRIRGAAVLSFLKSFVQKRRLSAFFMISAFLDGTVNGITCLLSGIALVVYYCPKCSSKCADRLQSARFRDFADKRKQLGSHLRKSPLVTLPRETLVRLVRFFLLTCCL